MLFSQRVDRSMALNLPQGVLRLRVSTASTTWLGPVVFSSKLGKAVIDSLAERRSRNSFRHLLGSAMLPEECKRRYNIKLWKQPLPEIGKCLQVVLRHISGVK